MLREQGDDHIRGSPHQPTAVEKSRDPQAAAASAATATAKKQPPATTTGIATATTKSDINSDKAHSCTQREYQQSAFSGMESDEIVPLTGQKQDQNQQTSNPYFSMPSPVRRTCQEGDPVPFQSPPRFGQDQHHIERSGTADINDPHEQSYQNQNPASDYLSPSYYEIPPPNQDGDASDMNSNQYHLPYPSYHHGQEYATHPQEYSDPYGYHPCTADSQRPASACPMQYTHTHQLHYHPTSASPIFRQPISDTSLKLSPSTVTESTNGSTPSIMLRKASSIAEGLNLSPSQEPQKDDRKPFAATIADVTPLKGILKKVPPTPEGQYDFEPIPLNEIAAIPLLSSSSVASAQHPSLHPYDAPVAPHDAFSQATSPQICSRASTVSASALVASYFRAELSTSDYVSPPVPRQLTRVTRGQKKQQDLAPSSGGNITISTGGGEGTSWEKRYNELIEFKRIHNHCEVPQNYAENTSLGTWVNKQRMEHKSRIEGNSSSLNDTRLERLQRIGFRWAKRKGQASWDEKFNELVAYEAKFGDCHVPTKYKDNTALGRWVSTQRAEYRKYQDGRKTSMNADKIRRLEGIGFAWFMAM
mmetsp:Transcript_25726/g.53740  ORF Transcript_25726/g.53740 Transcript_25726/m.53740 type:complete len:589 (-) Transcript_25726:420-2186(-)